MGRYGYSTAKHCRWDGVAYNATKPNDRDGFCCAKCKQAHYRAYKAYVTARSAGPDVGQVKSVTQNAHKKRAKPAT